MKKRVCIVTADNILPYRPSLLSMYDELTLAGFEVEIVSFQPGFVAKATAVEGRTVHYLPLDEGLVRTLNFLQNAGNFFLKRIAAWGRPFPFRLRLVLKLQVAAIIRFLRNRHYDAYIGVDPHGFYPIQALGRKGYFDSLEISPPDPYRRRIRQEAMLGIIIQSPARLAFLFPETTLPVYIIQNAPVYKPFVQHPPAERKHLIWAGSLLPEFGIYPLLNAVRANSQFVLYLKGGVQLAIRRHIEETYASELAAGRLVFDTTYIPGDAFSRYLNQFRIGFCFYDWDLLRQDYNYETSPSGKLYAYLAAGLPVIAPDTEGMSAVRTFNAGVLVPDYAPDTLARAVATIEADFESYVAGCHAAARHYSFDRMSRPFIEELQASLE